MSKAIIEKYMDDVWNKKELDQVYKVFSNHAVIHSPSGEYQSPQAMYDIVKKWVTAIPDVELTLLNTIEENGLVVSHWNAKGSHQSELAGVPASGNKLQYQGVTMYRFEGDKVVEYWAYIDVGRLNKQMQGS